MPRGQLLPVLNRGESVNALKRAIYTGRVATFQAKRPDELAAVEHPQQLAPERLVDEVVGQEHGAQQSTEVRDRLIERIAARASNSP